MIVGFFFICAQALIAGPAVWAAAGEETDANMTQANPERTEGAPAATRRIWRRVHRPEEYAEDIAVFLAKELQLKDKKGLVKFAPLIKLFVGGWEDAAVEYTEYVEGADGQRTLRTIFEITDYSNSSIYKLLEAMMKAMGIGKRPDLKEKDIDFVWILLGGVLEDYAQRAGLSPESTKELLDFRLINSDYLTVTSWKDGLVEIVNLKTGAVETLDLPDKDIDNVVGWSLNYFDTTLKNKLTPIKEGGKYYDDFMKLAGEYQKVVDAAAQNAGTE